MAIIKPFRALRPPRSLAEKVAALPYDVMNVAEARQMAAGNPASFLHISRPEIDLPDELDPHSDPVYRQGRINLQRFIVEGMLQQDDADCYYIYRQRMGAIVQTGLVACSGVDDYETGVIRKHELTRPDKEDDRVRHIDFLDANDEPVFYTFRSTSEIRSGIAEVTNSEPAYHFRTADGVEHTLWVVSDSAVINRFTSLFAGIPTLYVADGHHRSAAAVRVRELRRSSAPAHTGNEEYNYFLTVIFPDDELNIMPYNRVVKDLNGLSLAEFISRVGNRFHIAPAPHTPLTPDRRHQIGMYVSGTWYELVPKDDICNESDSVASLDVSLLQDNLLSPVLGIRNPRTDQRIHFVGGIRGVEELERLVNSGEYEVAFSLFPTSIDELITLADANRIMPPKSTWFEPKLRSGLFVHLLS